MKSKNGPKGGKMGGKKNTGYKNRGKTEVGKEAKVQSYKEYVQKMFGGGMTGPAMKKNKTAKGMAVGGLFKSRPAGKPIQTKPTKPKKRMPNMSKMSRPNMGNQPPIKKS